MQLGGGRITSTPDLAVLGAALMSDTEMVRIRSGDERRLRRRYRRELVLQGHVAERKRNPFVNSVLGARALSAIELPLFALMPFAAYGVLTTTGRKTGKKRRRCVRIVRQGRKAHLISIKGAGAGWARNIRANPEVQLRIGGRTFAGVGRELSDEETHEAMAAYCDTVTASDYFMYVHWRKGRPTRAKIKALLRAWFEEGTPMVIELAE